MQKQVLFEHQNLSHIIVIIIVIQPCHMDTQLFSPSIYIASHLSIRPPTHHYHRLFRTETHSHDTAAATNSYTELCEIIICNLIWRWQITSAISNLIYTLSIIYDANSLASSQHITQEFPTYIHVGVILCFLHAKRHKDCKLQARVNHRKKTSVKWYRFHGRHRAQEFVRNAKRLKSIQNSQHNCWLLAVDVIIIIVRFSHCPSIRGRRRREKNVKPRTMSHEREWDPTLQCRALCRHGRGHFPSFILM